MDLGLGFWTLGFWTRIRIWDIGFRIRIRIWIKDLGFRTLGFEDYD